MTPPIPPRPPRPLVAHTHGDPDDPCLEVCYTTARDRAAHRLADELDVPVELLTSVPTSGGVPLTDARLDDLAAEAERGYDLARLHPDRPRYRVLASRWYTHDPGTCSPEDPTHLGHLGFCHSGWELTIYRLDVGVHAPGGARAYAPLGITQTDRPSWDAAACRATVASYLRSLGDPRSRRALPADVDLYREVPAP